MTIRHSYEIGGYNYLHYWFQNSDLTINDFENAKRANLNRQSEIFDNYIVYNMGNDRDVIDSFLDLMQNNINNLDLSPYIEKIFANNTTVTAASPSGISFQGEELSYAQVKNKVTELGKVLVNSIGDFISTAEKYLQEYIDQMSIIYPDTLAQLLKNAATNRESMTKNELVQFYLQKGNDCIDTSVYNNNALNDAAKTIDRIEGLIQSLKNIDSITGIRKMSATYSHRSGAIPIKNRSQLVSILVGKLGGNFSHAGGTFEEIAAMEGLAQAIAEGDEAISIEKVHTGGATWTSNGQGMVQCNIKMREGGSGRIQDFKEAKSNSVSKWTAPKGDAEITLSKGRATMTFGMSTKFSKAVSPTNKGIIKLHDEVALGVLLQSLINKKEVDERYILNMAAAHDKSLGGEMTQQSNFKTSAAYIQGWKSLVDFATANWFLQALVGTHRSSAKNLVLVVNRQVYMISDIIKMVANNPTAIQSSGGRKRQTFEALNIWTGLPNKKSQAGAQLRSNMVKPELWNLFNNTKITIKLNMGTLGLSVPQL